MIKIALKPKEENDNIEELVLHNMKITDEMLNLELFAGSALAWFAINKGKTYIDLELFLRKNNMNTHLYAKPIKLEKGLTLYVPHGPKGTTLTMQGPKDNLIHECIYSCRPKPFALMEVLSVWSSYEENLNELSKAGSLIIASTHDCASVKEGEIITLNDKSVFKALTNKTIYEMIGAGEVWLVKL
jgi:hypothetical protein